MDIEDPIQQLLKNTGWSCDDLLAKLQKYKCQKEPNKEETVKPVDKDSVDDFKECIKDSTSEINNRDIPEVQNLEPKEKSDKLEDVYNEKTDIVIPNSHEEFSDTDEEEIEVNATNSSIINEIIDEISTGETEGSRDKNDNLDYQPIIDRDEATEITEVRVIQVNTDDEDDDFFMEDGYQNTRSSDDSLNSNKFEYLETYPRNISSVVNQALINELNCTKGTKIDEEESVNGCQVTNKKESLINEKEGNKNNELACKESDKSVVTIDERTDSTCNKTKLITKQRTDLSIKTSSENNVEGAEKKCSSKDLEVLRNSSKLQSNLSETCKETKLLADRSDPPYLDDERNIETRDENTEEKSISKNLKDTQNHLKLQLNTHKETKTTTGQKVDNSELGTNNKSHVEKESTSDLRDLQNDSKPQLNCLNTHKKTKLTIDQNIGVPRPVIEKNNDTDDVEEQSSSENLEDIRNNLKLQLSSLRTRKKGQFLQDLRNNVANVVDYNKKIVNNCDKDNSYITSIEKIDKSNNTKNKLLENEVPSSKSDNIESVDLDDKLYTQTNEFGLVILNVQGGIDIDEIESCENHSPEDNLNENSSNTNNSVLETGADFNDNSSFSQSNVETDDREIEQSNGGVFDEIRKIIRKQKVNMFKKNKKTVAVLDRKVDKPKRNIDNFGFFTGSSELEATEEKTSDYGKSRLNTDVSAENSSSSYTVEDTNQAVDKNSPFVSNTLDEFLTGDSKLNISYNVPKCGAEEGLSESYHEESPLLLKKVIKVNREQSPKPKKMKTIKAKTLAQKRKMLEKQRLKQMKDLKQAVELNKKAIKPEITEATQEKNYSFVMVNDTKIWVKSATPVSCIAKINTKKATVADEVEKRIKIKQPQRKLSLLTDLGKKLKEQVKYRPGPMCKKANLQISGRDNWETEMKTLPKISLEVIPKIGKPIPPKIISRLPQCDGKLTENQIEFALSVLKTKTETDVESKIFTFPLPYRKNQEKIFVRKQKVSPIKYATSKKYNEEKSVDSVVADVIEDLMTYIEIKEMAPTLIKDEERIRDTVADDKFAKMPMISDSVSSIFKKPQKKRSRIELELSRLSCKVVNVEVEENLTREICNKPYCQLGCVCNSLKCDRILSYHCGRVQCMLDCTCPKERALVYDKVTLPAGTDILSTDAVSRIEDEAKKDLAKVEREFTQTVIHTSDKTIVVGLGGRNKTKRTTKVPKKYSDYVDSFEGIKEEEKEKDVDKNDFLRKCVVSLENLNLSAIIPFCLTHDLYNCHCKGRSSYKSDRSLTKLNVDPIVIEDDDEIVVKKQTNHLTKYKNKLKHAKESDVERVYNPKKSIQITPANGHEKSHNEVGSSDIIEKKQIANLKKHNKTKTSALESAQGHKETHMMDTQEEFFPFLDKQLSKTVMEREKREKKQTANPKKTGKIKTAQLKSVKEDTDTHNGEEVQKIIENKISTLKTPNKNKTSQLKKAKDLKENPSESDSISSPAENVSSTGRPIRNITKTKLRKDFSYHVPEDCARVRGISKDALRNCKYIKKNKRYFQKNDFINNISEADLLKSKINYIQNARQMLEVDLLKKHLIEESNRQKNALSLLASEDNKHKRKQTLEVRNDDNSTKMSFNQAIQRRKKLAYVTQKNTVIEPVFDGEIIIDSRNMELLEKMGTRTVMDGYARLLPWKALTESYRNGSIKIWSMVDTPSRLLINKSDKLPPKNYVNITQVTSTTEVIMWINQNKLPPSYHEDHVSFILKQTKDHYEICGLCTKNFNEDAFTSEASNKSCSESESVVEQAEESLTPFHHKDLNGIAQLLYIKKDTFKLQELIEENLAAVGETSIEKNRLYMWAALPEILRVGKWRIIFLNSDFTYLYFTKLKYSIKYTDLIGIGNMAKAGNCTVMLRNPLIQQTYKHESFGIYFDSHYQDRIFIGPYATEFNGDDIETLRYINKSLVCNESFHKMIGKTDYKCGHWLIERPYGQIETEPEQTIDLTHDSYQILGKRKRISDADQSAKRLRIKERKKKERIVIMHNKEQIRVIDSTPRNPEDFNRYIITNIPHFGYLGAYKHNNSNEIDVSWPFENKLLRFPTVNSAIDFLQERFSSLLQPIPETFKINVIVLTQIDLQNSHPVDAKILSGHYICGDFGYYNVKNISNELCESIVGMTRDELLRIFAKRAQAFVRTKIEELADLLSIEKSEVGRYDIVNILEMAQKEIAVLKATERRKLAQKNERSLRRRDLAVKVLSMISALPEKEQVWENLKFRKIIDKSSPKQLKDKTEPIVIPDSDDEEETVSNNTIISKVRSHDGSMVSVLNNQNIPTKVTETASPFPPRPNIKLKSVLKPLLNSPTATALSRVKPSSSVSKVSSGNLTDTGASPTVLNSKTLVKPQYLTGVKIVKTSSGKFVLVSDKNDSKPFRMPDAIKGTKIIIKNSKILSVKKIDADNNDCVQDISASDSTSKKVNVTPTQESSPTSTSVIVSGSILDATSSNKDSDTQPCLENESLEKSTVSESSEILNDSENSIKEISTEVSDESLSVPIDKDSGDNDSHTEVNDENR